MRHHHIEDDSHGQDASCTFQTLVAARNTFDMISFFGQIPQQQIPNGGIIVDDEDGGVCRNRPGSHHGVGLCRLRYDR